MNETDNIKYAGFLKTFQTWPVTEDWVQELFNYFICGWHPGSFHRACFANNLFRASLHTHPSNEWKHIVEMMKWINEFAPEGSWGSYENVNQWLELTSETRGQIIRDLGWSKTDEEVTWEILSDEQHV